MMESVTLLLKNKRIQDEPTVTVNDDSRCRPFVSSNWTNINWIRTMV